MTPAPSPVRLAALLGCLTILGAAPRSEAGPRSGGDSDPFSWAHYAGPPPTLVYGEPDTDNLSASFECLAGSGRVKLNIKSDGEQHPYGAHWRAHVRLASGASRRVYAARGEAADLGETLSAAITTRDPLLRAFAESGQLSIEGFAQNAETPAERRAIRAFLAICR
jgi:hypothetical protein